MVGPVVDQVVVPRDNNPAHYPGNNPAHYSKLYA